VCARPDAHCLHSFITHASALLQVGFQETDIGSICSMGKSSKRSKPGYTGQKGIGFKSVFQITDCPSIHSNGFHIKFDLNLDPMLGA